MRRFITAVALTALSLAFGLHSGRPAAAAAFDLRATQSCEWNTPGLLSADISWSAGAGSAQQWLDVSVKDNGWAYGTFISFPVAPNATSMTLPYLSPNTTYYVEVAQMFADGSWDFSPTRMLKTGSCFVAPTRAALPYGAFDDQNPASGPRIVTAMGPSDATPGSTSTTSTSKDNNSSNSSTGSGSSSPTSTGTKNTCVSTSSGSIVQAPLNAGSNGVANCPS